MVILLYNISYPSLGTLKNAQKRRQESMLTIESYSFGNIKINGKVFTSDLIILPDSSILGNWYRKTGHALVRADIEALIAQKPDQIIVGTGAYDRMVIDPALENDLTDLRIDLKALPSKEAADLFNRTKKSDKKIGACFHLTC